MSSDAKTESRFIFVVCQNGAETAARTEILSAHPNLRLAFSRPGFITFKVDAENELPEKFNLRSTLARAYGWSMSKATGTDAAMLVKQVSQEFELSNYNHLHIWQRDPTLPGSRGFEPGTTPLVDEIGKLFQQKFENSKLKLPINQYAEPDDRILDVVLVEPDQWWIGEHYATTVAARWPGGVPKIDTSKETISRAYLKIQEALAWSGINVKSGDICAEIGSAPGGSCQWLLEQGAIVIGIDPAEMEPEVLDHPNFTHIRRRGREVKKRDLKDVKWLFADLSIVPKYTLDTVSEIVSHEAVDVKGLVLTMKLTDWKLVDDVPDLMKRVRELGFGVVKSRQLAFNRREFCLAAAKDKFVLRVGKRAGKKAEKKPTPKKQAEPKQAEPKQAEAKQAEAKQAEPKPLGRPRLRPSEN